MTGACAASLSCAHPPTSLGVGLRQARGRVEAVGLAAGMFQKGWMAANGTGVVQACVGGP